ncbi:GlsB/YeaQ/YmgE family stress response membrane protein [Asticcacaulis endophyticus]|uniref:GlsB/YeaQ/YmgE family stress response membrane protein n=1 Tax=Asticcacaulis endophyticus TaxID=1395890 RepID=A0A918Q052_9CAUL|nr:GlsB/YeaQ/YmgE family stress response membrane protein [Asticcacaulis endophyticus]GGZ26443.1 hypothetical protein GCM10011273_09970 [Asticcacaulis endophyticus]
MTDMQIGWIIAMATGALIGAVAGLIAIMAKTNSKLWFNVVLGVFGAIMTYTVSFLLGIGAGTAGAVVIGTAGAIFFLTAHHIILNRRTWAKW